jgi:hypothetical protein
MAVHLTGSDCKGRCVSNVTYETDDVLWNGSEEDVNVMCVLVEDEGTD